MSITSAGIREFVTLKRALGTAGIGAAGTGIAIGISDVATDREVPDRFRDSPTFKAFKRNTGLDGDNLAKVLRTLEKRGQLDTVDKSPERLATTYNQIDRSHPLASESKEARAFLIARDRDLHRATARNGNLDADTEIPGYIDAVSRVTDLKGEAADKLVAALIEIPVFTWDYLNGDDLSMLRDAYESVPGEVRQRGTDAIVSATVSNLHGMIAPERKHYFGRG